MAELNLTKVVTKHGDRTTIISYEEGDFRTFWDSRCKSLLHKRECEIVKKLLPPSEGWFIDLGCGFGRLAPAYLDAKKHIVAVDYSVKHLEIAQETYPEDNVFFIAADACHLPFRDGVFQSGICIRLLHHIASPGALLCELSRIFADEAFLVFNYMNKRNLMRILKYGRDSFEHDHKQIHDVLFATHPKFLKRLTRNCGFRTISQEGTGFTHQITHRCALMERIIDEVPSLIHLLAVAEKIYGLTLGNLRLALMQYSLLKKVSDDEVSWQSPMPRNIVDILLCPRCHSVEMCEDEDEIKCTNCGKSYPKNAHIYDFRLS